MQWRPLVFCTAVLVPAYGAQLSEIISCGTPITVVTSLPASSSNIYPPPLRCGFSDQGVSFEAFANAGDFHLEAVADQETWPFPLSLSSRVELEGRFLLSNVTVATVVSWSACVTSSVTGPGLGLVTGAYGPYGIGSPCDFAHSQPLLPNNEIDEFFTLYAQGAPHSLEDVIVNIQLNFFDATGTPRGAGFRYSVLPGDIPEPSTLLLVLLPGFVIIRRSVRH